MTFLESGGKLTMQRPMNFSIKRCAIALRALSPKACLIVSSAIPLLLAPAGLAQINKIEPLQFIDVSSHWAEACIEGAGRDKLMSGYLDQSFRPNGTMTRAEFAAAIVKAFPNAPTVREAPIFSDIPRNFWGKRAIETTYERGFLSGYPRNLFKPNQAISRVQAMVIIANTQAQLGSETLANSDQIVLDRFFEDVAAIPDYARAAIAHATRTSLVVNYPNAKQLRPNDSITRAEATALLCRVNEDGTDARHYVAADYVAAFGYQFNTAGLPTAARPEPVLLGSFDSELNDLVLWEGIEVNEQLFFINNKTDASKLWKTNGTAAGTQLVQSLDFGQEGDRTINTGGAYFFGVGDERLWIRTQQSSSSPEKRAGIWSSQGTTRSTQEIANFSPELAEAIAQSERIQTGWYPTIALGDRAPLILKSRTDSQLWITDGKSRAGTEKLAIFNGAKIEEQGLPSQQFTATDDYLFFIATAKNKGDYNIEWTDLWRTDGTVEGTLSLKEIGRLDPSEPLLSWQNRVYFIADTPEAGAELWTSDGTTAGTLLLKDIYPGEKSASVSILGHTKTATFMLANSPEGIGLWKTEGTPESTRLVKRLGPESQSSDVSYLHAIDEERFFFNRVASFTPAAGITAYEIWISDGTPSGTQRVDELPGRLPTGATTFKGKLFFSHRSPSGEELWISDGTAKGTHQLVDLTPGINMILAPCPPPPTEAENNCPPPSYAPKDTWPRGFVVQGEFLYFIATDNRLFRTDGTIQGTELVSLLDGYNSPSSNMRGLGDKLLFMSRGNQTQLWAIPQTEATN